MVFSPTKISLYGLSGQDNVFHGIVMFRSDDEDMLFRTEITAEWLHSIVINSPGNFQAHANVKRINPLNNEQRSVLAWQFLLDDLKKELGEDVILKKSELGYPVIIKDGKELDIPVSLSHDGDFAAYSFRIPV